jgi:hypothetical protein
VPTLQLFAKQTIESANLHRLKWAHVATGLERVEGGGSEIARIATTIKEIEDVVGKSRRVRSSDRAGGRRQWPSPSPNPAAREGKTVVKRHRKLSHFRHRKLNPTCTTTAAKPRSGRQPGPTRPDSVGCVIAGRMSTVAEQAW